MLWLTRVSDTAETGPAIDAELLVKLVVAGVSIALFSMGITLLVVLVDDDDE